MKKLIGVAKVNDNWSEVAAYDPIDGILYQGMVNEGSRDIVKEVGELVDGEFQFTTYWERLFAS